jgi:hypothetical protein
VAVLGAVTLKMTHGQLWDLHDQYLVAKYDELSFAKHETVMLIRGFAKQTTPKDYRSLNPWRPKAELPDTGSSKDLEKAIASEIPVVKWNPF